MRPRRRPATKYSTAVVTAKIRAHIAGDDREAGGYYQLPAVRRAVMTELGDGSYNWQDLATERQIAQVMDTLAGKGELVKVRRQDVGPDGRTDGRQPRYYTPAGFKAAQAKYAVELAMRDVLRERWAAVYDRLLAMGMQPVPTTSQWGRRLERGDAVTVSLADWERITGISPG